ncbi:esterase [Gordonia phage GretelLyn]|uniref:Esterase n=3 Tax=Lambovirus TaxID=2843412 RepID=A0A5J6TEF6_9CAUD|nr:tail fiber protein [Gordonia phage Sadboi]YP_009853959.1 tail fiber protein [Gordonia phage Yikes]QFG08147.1 esterase [Gordonia phage GretelLyn]QFG14657.1 esterase [Gordonia phage Sadboi]QGJ90996.1 esterase [Gordonia phage Yikes]
MANVWYIGDAQERTVTFSGSTFSWNIWNGWSIPESAFNAGQLAELDADPGFLLGQTGQRVNPPWTPDGVVGRDAAILAKMLDIYNEIPGRLSEASMKAAFPRVIKRPDWMPWDYGFTILFDGTRFFTNYDVSVKKNRTTQIVYVHTVQGDNTTGNGTPLKPYRSINRGVTAVSDGGTVIVMNGDPIYRATNIDTTADCTKSVNIIFADPETKVVAADALTYTLSSGQTNVYEAARTNVLKVIDTSVDPEGVEYARVADIATCEATDGSWFQAANGTGPLYVNPIGSGAPAAGKVFALLQDACLRFATTGRSSAMNVYIEGGRFFGGTIGVLNAYSINAHKLTITTKNSKFLHGGYGNVGVSSPSGLYNGLVILGNVEYWGQKTVVAHSGLDGFNYHAQGGYIPKFVEIDCEAHDCGTGPISVAAGVGNTQNGSTAHDGIVGVRVGGKYWKTFGAPLADVQEGTVTLNFSCESGYSTDPGGNNASFCAQQAGAIMGVFGCVAWGTTWHLYAVTGATIYYDSLTKFSTVQGGGTRQLVEL